MPLGVRVFTPLRGHSGSHRVPGAGAGCPAWPGRGGGAPCGEGSRSCSIGVGAVRARPPPSPTVTPRGLRSASCAPCGWPSCCRHLVSLEKPRPSSCLRLTVPSAPGSSLCLGNCHAGGRCSKNRAARAPWAVCAVGGGVPGEEAPALLRAPTFPSVPSGTDGEGLAGARGCSRSGLWFRSLGFYYLGVQLELHATNNHCTFALCKLCSKSFTCEILFNSH